MSAGTTHRALPATAAVLALAIVALAVVWWTRGQGVPAVPEQPPRGALAPVAVETAGDTVPTTSRATQGAGRGTPDGATDATTRSATNAVLYGAVSWPQPQHRPQGWLALHRDGQRVGFVSLEGGNDVFTFAGLTPGRHSLRGEAPDCLPLEMEADVRAPQTRLDVRFGQAWLLAVNVVVPAASRTSR